MLQAPGGGAPLRKKVRRPAPVAASPRTPAQRKLVLSRKGGPSLGASVPGDTKNDIYTPTNQASVNQSVKEARIRYIRRTRKQIDPSKIAGAVVGQTKKELEGRGAIAGVLSGVGDRAASGTFSGQTNKRLGLGNADIGAQAIKDVVNLPAQVIPSVYVPVAGAVEAAQGRPQRIKKLGQDINKHDAVYNLAAAGIDALAGDTKGASGRWKASTKSFREHPGFALAEGYGVRGVVGRGAGATMRTGALGKTVKQAASTTRAPATLAGTSFKVPRQYPKDVIRKGIQVNRERGKIKQAAELRAKAQQIEASARPNAGMEAAALRAKARRVDPNIVGARQIARGVDERVAVNEDLRRLHRPQVIRNVHVAVKPAKSGKGAVSLVAQNITKATPADLEAYRAHLQAVHPTLDRAGQYANHQLRRAIHRAIQNGDMAGIQQAAKNYHDIVAPLQKKLTDRGLIDPAQATKAELIPYAVRFMGAKHDAKPRAPTHMKARHELAKEAARAAQFAASVAGRDVRSRQLVATKARQLGLVEQTTRRKVVARRGDIPLSNMEIRLSRRPLAPAERAAVERRLAEFNNQARASVVSAKAFAAGQAKTAKVAKKTAKRARPKKYVPGIVGPDGEPLTTADIRAHMKANGVPDPTFITQAPNMGGGRNFNIRSERVQGIQSRKRTGQATQQGTFSTHPETLKENAARMQGLVDATDGFRGFVKDFGYRHPDTGKLVTRKSRKEIDKVAANIGLPGEQQWRAIRVNPFAGSKAQLHSLLENVDSQAQTAKHGQQGSPLVQAQVDALAGKGEGQWALIPEEAAQRLQQHLNTQGTGAFGKGAQVINQTFRRTVLATSLPWALGNTIEATFRSALAKAGPASYVRGRQALKVMGEAGQARTVGGGHYAFADRTIHRSAEQFTGTAVQGLAQTLGKFWRSPGPRHAATAWNWWTHYAFGGMRLVEQQFQTAMLGRAIKNQGLVSGRLAGVSQRAMQDAAQGLHDTANQAALGREIDRMYGQYNKWGPTQRQAIAYYTPFIAWTLNAARFVADVLPKDHPVALTVIAAAENATEEWRKDHGLDLFMQGAVPGWLQGSIPVSGGGHQRVPNRYLPFGAFGDFGGTLAGNVLPQYSGPLMAFKGLDWKGRKLRNPDGSAPDPIQTAEIAAKAFLGATVPILSQAGRVKAKGLAALNPIAVVKPKAAAGGGGGRKVSRTDSFDFSGGADHGFDFSGGGGGSGGFDFGG